MKFLKFLGLFLLVIISLIVNLIELVLIVFSYILFAIGYVLYTVFRIVTEWLLELLKNFNFLTILQK